MENKLTLFKKWKILFFFLVLICCSTTVDASHFRGGTITWECTSTPNEVQFTIKTAWRYGGSGTVGGTGRSYRFRHGDGTSQFLAGTIDFISTTNDYVTQTLVYNYTYSSPGSYLAEMDDCCRISGLPNGWSSADFVLQSNVVVGATCNEPPTLAVPAFINVVASNTQTCFQLNAIDPEGDALTYSIATSAKSGLFPSPASAWPAGTLDAVTGEICVNPTTMPGAPSGGYPDGTLIPLPIVVEDSNGNGTAPGDLMFFVNNVSGVAPVWDYTITPADGSSINFFADTPGTINLEAEDSDAGNTVDIQPFGVPIGATFSPTLPNTSNPNVTALSWTPTIADAGSYPITLIAEDNTGQQTSTSFTINVIACSAPVASCQDVTVGLDVLGNLILNPSAVDNVSTASCGIQSITVSPNMFDCTAHGTTTSVTLTVTDTNGASDQCTADVTIMDMIAPDPVCDLNAATSLDLDGLRSVLASQMDSGSDDNCTSATDLRFSYSQGDVNDTIRTYTCADVGLNMVDIWVWDLAGNESVVCNAQLVVADNTAPDCDVHGTIDAVLDHMGTASITASDIDDGSSDACGIDTMYIDVTDFDCADIASNPQIVTLTVIDNNGNSSTCTTDVIVRDTAHIHVHTRDTLLTLNAAGMVTVNADDIIRPGTLYDNCGIADTVVSPNMLNCLNIGTPTTVTLTVTDVNGNTLTDIAQVSVQDITPPTAVCQATTIFLDAAGVATVIPADLDGGSTDACGIDPLGYSVDIATFDCSFVGTTQTVVLTVTDMNGNTATCDADVTIEDEIDPTAICQDITVDLDASGSVTVTSADIDNGSNDNCGSVTLTSSDATYDCTNVGTNDYTLTIEDPSGNAASCIGTVTVRDITPPTMVCASPTIILDPMGMGTITVADVNGGSTDACGITSYSVGPEQVGCDPTDFSDFSLLGDYNGHTYYRSNAQFNFADAIADATLHGGMLADISDATENGIASLGVGTCWIGFNDIMIEGMFVWNSGQPVSYTNWLGGEPNNSGNEDATIINFGGSGLWNDVPVGLSYFYILEIATPAAGEVPVVLNATDANGNTASCLSVATIVDDTPPTTVCQDITVQLDAAGVGSLLAADIDDGSTDACGIDTMYVDVTDFDCTNVGANTVTLTVVDNNGNMATCTSTVTVEDNVNPECQAMDITVVLDALGSYTVNAQDIDDGSTDACGIASYEIRRVGDPTFSPSISVSCSDTGIPPYPTAVELQVTDVNGNSSICTANVTVLDETSPFLNCQDNIVVSLNSDGDGALIGINLLAWWGIFDACGIQSILVDGAPVQLYDCSDVGFFDVDVQAIDNNGNMTACTVEIEVRDQRNPDCIAKDSIIYLDAAGLATLADGDLDDGSSDNCGIASITLDITSFSCTDIGSPVTVTQTVVDVNGNDSQCTSTVTVLDTISPICATMDITAQLLADGTVSIDSNAVDNVSTDACGIASITLDVQDFACADVNNPVTVTQTVTDVNGNTSSCTAVVTVEDNVAPIALCQNVVVMLDASGNGVLDVNDLDDGSSDACGIASLVASQTAFDCSMVGANMVTLTVTDVNGNTAECTATATVVDAVVPTAICADITVQLDANGLTTVNAADIDGGSFDNCAIADICIGKGVPASSLAGELSLSDPTFFYDRDPTVDVCFYDPAIYSNTGFELVEGLHHYDQQQFSVTAADTYTFTLNDVNGSTDFMGLIYSDSFDPMDLCANIVVGDDDGNPGGIFDPQIVLTVTMAPGNYIIVTSTYGTGDDDFDAPYTWDLSSAGGGTLSAFECLSSIDYDCAEEGDNTATLCVTDVNGNVSYCSATVTVEDNVDPIATCMDITVQLDATGVATIDSNAVDGGSMDACGIASFATDITSFSCADLGSNTVELTVEDVNGNTSTCTATVTVEDNVDPVAICQDITVMLDASGDGSIVASDLDGGSTDACGPLSFSADMTAFDCSNVGPNTVTLTVMDGSGNSSTCTATVTVEDNVDPDAVCMDITVQLNFDGDVTITGAMIDGGSTDACGIASLDAGSGTVALDCSNVGPNTVTLTVTDVNGNTATCDATVTVEDNIAPLVNCVNNVEVPLNTNGIGFVTKQEVTGAAFDACGIVDTFIIRNDDVSHPDYGIENDQLLFDCDDIGLVPVIIRVYDTNGNVEECNTAVNVKDEILPTMLCTSTTLYLDANGVAALDSNALDNGSFDNCAIVEFSVSQTDFDCSDLGMKLVTMTAEDQSGNTSACSNGVMVVDTVSPVAMCQDITIQLDANGDATIVGSDLDNGSTDACGPLTFTADITAFDCTMIGTNMVTMTATDGSGNSSTCTSTVTVEDLIAPDCQTQDITIPLDATGNASITAAMVDDGSTDACGIASMSVSPDAFTCAEVGANTVTLTLTDVNGNVSTCTAEVTIEDVTGPDCQTQDITVQLDATGNASITAAMVDDGSTDACGIASMSVSPDAFTCAEVGANTVTLTLTDVNGNVSTCTAEVTVEDVTGPDCQTQDITVQLDATGNASITAAMVDDGSTDACGIASMSVSPDAFTCAEVGANTVTLTLTDVNGNVSTCTAEVTIEDVTGPDCQTQDITVQLDATGNASITAAMVDNASTDACGIASMSVSPDAFTCAEVGANTVTLTLTDVNGNVSTCTAEVTVEDNVAPVASCMAITVELDANGDATIADDAVNDGSSDACGIASYSTDITVFDCSQLGDNTVTMTVTDVNGNVSTCDAVVTVIDVTGPVLTCPADVIVNTLPSDCNQNVIMPELTPMDVCTGSATYVYSAPNITFINTGLQTFALFPVGSTEVTATATDGFGNTSDCTFNVIVVDNINPIIVGCAAIGNITVDGDASQCGANVTWDETMINANDNCSGQGAGVLVTSDFDSGDLFPIGTTTVTYTAMDDAGNTATCSFDVTVNPTLPVSDFSALPTSLSVIFTNESTNGISNAWDFGDGNTSTDESPTHPYAAAGTYNVCLTVENACGDTDMYCEDVTVADTGECLDVVTLNAGWNLLSFDVDPTDNTIATVFADEITAGNLLMMTAFNGVSGATIFDPLLPPFLNTLQTIDPGYGYWVNVINASSVSVVGDCIDASFKIDLTTGWNLVSYIPQMPSPPQIYFDNLITNGWLDLASGYDEGSTIYDPSFPIPALNTLTDLENGLGYWVKVNTDVAAGDYLKGSTGSTSTREGERTDEWGNLQTNAYDFLSGRVEGVQDGEKINVVNAFGDLIIELEVIHNGYLKLTPLYGDDTDTPDVTDGLIYEESLFFEYAGTRSDISIDFEGSSQLHFVELDFEEVSTAVVSLDNKVRASIAPNPMFNSTTLTIDVPQTGNYSISLIDMTGKNVRSIHSGLINAGQFETSIQRNGLIAGQYMIAIIGDNEDSFVRISLLIIN